MLFSPPRTVNQLQNPTPHPVSHTLANILPLSRVFTTFVHVWWKCAKLYSVVVIVRHQPLWRCVVTINLADTKMTALTGFEYQKTLNRRSRSLNCSELYHVTGRDMAAVKSARRSAYGGTRSMTMSPSSTNNDAYLGFLSVEDMFKISFLK
jgi:hypothetical protein